MSRFPKNLLIITADEMRADCTGFAGSSDARTPHLDALAARSTMLANHFTTYPKCVPARCSMLTGRHPHTDGFRSVSGENHLPEGSPELAGCLRAAGWQTAVLGLNHVWEDGWFYGRGERTNEPGAGAVDMTSFTRGIAHLAASPVQFPAGAPRTEPPELGMSQFRGLLTGEKANFNDVNRTTQAVHWLRECRDPSRPFFLQVNLSNPHPPYAAPAPYYSAFRPEGLREFPFELPQNAPLCMRAQRRWRLGDDASEAAMREIRAVYLAMIAFVDAQIGRILTTVRELGLEGETLLVFTSDHGDYAGQHGLVEKWDTDFRDGLLHVPFLVAGPDIPRGVVRRGLSDHSDLVDTFLEIFDIEPAADWNRHGQSLVPLLAGGSGKQAVFASGGHEAPMRRRFPEQADALLAKNQLSDKQRTYLECPEAMARAKMVRTPDWKLVVRETGDDELYHLERDPWEMHNLYGEPGHEARILDLQRQMLDWTLRTDPDQPHLSTFGA